MLPSLGLSCMTCHVVPLPTTAQAFHLLTPMVGLCSHTELQGGGGCGTTAAGCFPGEPGVPSGAGGRGGQVRGLAGVEAAGAGHCTAQHESAARIIGGHHLRKGVKGGNV